MSTYNKKQALKIYVIFRSFYDFVISDKLSGLLIFYKHDDPS